MRRSISASKPKARTCCWSPTCATSIAPRSRRSPSATASCARTPRTPPSSRTMNTSSSWIKNLSVVALSVAIALVLGEVALRVAGFAYPNFWEPDPLTGSKLRPGMEGWQKDEGQAYVKISSQGLRDREHPLAKPAGTYRIAVLGDSYSEATQGSH